MDGFNYNITIEDIILRADNSGYFKNFFKIVGRGNQAEKEKMSRVLRVKNFKFTADGGTTIIKNNIQNSNIVFDLFTFMNVKAFGLS